MFSAHSLLFGLIGLIVIMDLPALANPKAYRKAIKPFLTKTENLRIIGFFVLIISFFFLTTHWRLNADWMLTISLIGWAGLVKAIWLIWFPESVKKLSKKMFLKSDRQLAAWSFIAVIFGIALCYIALNKIAPGAIV